MKLNHLKYCLLLIIVVTSNKLIAQYSPYFQNYSLSEYNAGNQNWDISRADNGKLYVANNNGLLEYDGINWNFKELPNKTTIRSVFAHNNKIFTGSYEEFGYWQKNSKGELIYSSLIDQFKLEESLNEEFWQILAYKNAIVFRSFLNIYIYENEKITKIKPKSTVISCNVVKGQLYVSTLKDGIFLLDNSTLISVVNNEILRDTKVISISDYNSNLLITTSLKGNFILDKGNLTPLKSEVNELIKQHQLNDFIQLDNGNMIFGTIKNGLYYTDSSGKIIFHINKENGLINNTVLSQCLLDQRRIWLGLDNGLALINLDSYSSFYNDLSGKLGAVYDVIKNNGTFYIGSNTGLYFLDYDNNLQFIKESQGQVWNLKEINGQLLCGHNNGTYLVKNKKLELISEYTGGWTIKKVPEKRNTYIQGTYAGLVKFQQVNSNWRIKHLGKTTIPVRFLVFEDEFTAWAAHAYKGLFRIKFDDNYDTILDIKSYENKGIESIYNVRVYKIKNDICFKTNNGWQKYEPILDSIVPFDLLNDSLGKDSYIISEEEVDQLVLKNDNGISSFSSFINNGNELNLSKEYYRNRLIVGYEKVSQINDSIYALSLNEGFMLINAKKHLDVNILYKPDIEKLKVDDDLMELDKIEIVELNNNSKINVSMSSARSSNHFFEYSIPEIDSSNWFKVNQGKLALSNLKSGDFSLLLRTANESGYSSTSQVLSLSVLPPWYKSNIGLLLYGILILITISIFYLLHKRKIKKEQRLLQEEFESAQRELLKEKNIENDKKLIELKNESLQNEIKLKSKQLANTAMALVKKNEALLDLKKELQRIKINFDSNFTFKRLQKKIDNTIGHEDEWEVFEYNFNQVHEEFFNQLKDKHPHLTHKDLKICAYIKMNLTTKEIAPLMNISTRGVETHRYRLKRKMNLEADEPLTTYIFSFD